MQWRKLGRIFCPRGDSEWMRSHASNCVAWPIGDWRHRIYFTTRDAGKRGSVGWVEIDLRRPLEVLAVSAEPVLVPGPAGSFDDRGISLGCLLSDGDTLLLYYMGWNVVDGLPWRNRIGLAVSRDGLRFEASSKPVLDCSRLDPYTLSYPFVTHEGDEWRMWYGSNLRPGTVEREMNHVIKYASGPDAATWRAAGDVCIGIENESEYAFARPSVLRDGDRWKMWYSFRGERYRIGYAESADGLRWIRRDEETGIAPSAEGWDSQSIEYPLVFDHRGQRYMLYNGNGYGATGFGIAVLESD